MMLCKADFEDLFSDLFGPEKLKGAKWHPARRDLCPRSGSDPLSNARGRMIGNVGTSPKLALMPRIQSEVGF